MADKMMRIAGRSEAGVAKAIKTDEQGNLEVSTKGKFEVLHTGTTATGGGVVIDSSGMASGTLRVSGTFVATLGLQGRMSPSHPWLELPVLNPSTKKAVTTFSTSGLYQFDCQGMNQVRLAIHQYTSGSINAEVSVKPFGFSPLTTTTEISNDKLLVEKTGSRTARLHTASSVVGGGSAIDTTNMGSGTVVISGNFSANMTMQGRVGTLPFSNIPVIRISTGEVVLGQITTPGAYAFSCQGFTAVRLGINSLASGSVTADCLLEPYSTPPIALITKQAVSIVENLVKPDPVLPVAFPERDLEMVDVIEMGPAYGQVVEPKSVGFDDGVIYGVAGLGKRLVKINNGFATKSMTDLEFGFDFATNPDFVGLVAWVEKTFAGFVVVETIQGTPNTSNIWFSPTFTGGFSKVATLDRGRVTEFNFTSHHGGPYNTVLMASEYPSNINNHVAGQEPRLFMSLDGGATWQLIKTLSPPVNPAFNNHIHTQVYDQYDARIYMTNGDGDNAKLEYSDDLGATWRTVPLSSYTDLYPSHHPQPTLMIATPNKIVMSHDNGLPGGILSLIKDKKYTSVGGETFSWKFEYATYPHMSGASGKFGFTYVQRGKELYIVIPTFQNHKQAHIVGSGDGGNTFYNVGSLNLTNLASNQETRQLTGFDKNGFMYLTFGTTRIAKYRPAVWLYS